MFGPSSAVVEIAAGQRIHIAHPDASHAATDALALVCVDRQCTREAHDGSAVRGFPGTMGQHPLIASALADRVGDHSCYLLQRRLKFRLKCLQLEQNQLRILL